MNIFLLVVYIIGSFMMFSVALADQSWWYLVGGLWGVLNAHGILMEWEFKQKAAEAAKESQS